MFEICEPYHQRWEMGKGYYIYNAVIFGNDLKIDVIQKSSGRSVESRIIKLDDPHWKRKAHGHQLDMEKIYS